MPKIMLYHNPRCSKSRQALAIIREQGIEPVIIEYLKQPLSEGELTVLLGKLKIKASELIRYKESLFSELGLSRDSDESVLIAAMSEHPILIERPIAVCGQRACLGRPPENVLELLA